MCGEVMPVKDRLDHVLGAILVSSQLWTLPWSTLNAKDDCNAGFVKDQKHGARSRVDSCSYPVCLGGINRP
jgi:hypothetical protein